MALKDYIATTDTGHFLPLQIGHSNNKRVSAMKCSQSLGNDIYSYLKNAYIVYELTIYREAHKQKNILTF